MKAEILQIRFDAGETRIKSKSISILKHSERAHIYISKKDQTLNNGSHC